MRKMYFNRSHRKVIVRTAGIFPALIKPGLFAGMILLLLASFILNAAPVDASIDYTRLESDTNSYVVTPILDKTITWADGTTERVQIGSDGFFVLNGVKKKLVGMDLQTVLSWDWEGFQYWLPDRLAIWDKELAFLESKGVRVISFTPQYTGFQTEAARYGAVFDLIYKHKMLALPHIQGKGFAGFGDLTNPDFSITIEAGVTDSMGAYAGRFADAIAKYPNVITTIIENELNLPLEAQRGGSITTDQMYTPAAAANYISYIENIFQSRIKTPVVHNLTGVTSPSNLLYRPDIMKAVLPATDLPAFTMYATSLDRYKSDLANLTSWLKDLGYPTTGWWIQETNARPYANSFTTEWIDAAFNSGASLVIMHCTNHPTDQGYSFFDTAGNPIPALVKVSDYVNTVQQAITTVPVDPPAASGNAIASLTLTNGGSGFASTPTVTISGGNGTGATAVASLGKKVESISVTNGGRDYTTAPKVIITGGGGSGATAVAKVQPGTGARATVLSVTVTNGGSGYTSAPTVTFQSSSGSRASAQAVLSLGIVTKLTLTNPGSGYTTVPTVTISGGGGAGAAATATLATTTTNTPPSTTVIEGVLASLKVTSGGVYKSVPTIVISGGGGTGAKAIANISRSGSRYTVASVTITNPGSGYTSAPTVTFSGGGGSGAQATAIIK